MLRNYLTVFWRSLYRDKAYTVINITGLTVGLAVCLLILLFVRHELSYDRFHEHADRIYRVTLDMGDWGGARLPASVAPYLTTTYPEVEAAVRFYPQEMVIRSGSEWVREGRFFYADPSVFDTFSFALCAGDTETALAEPGSIVLTASTARRHFGDVDPMGRTLVTNDGRTFRVTGVVRDVPSNAHLHFDCLASFATLGQPTGFAAQGHTYLLLEDGRAAGMLKGKLDAFTDQGPDTIHEAVGWCINGMALGLQPLTGIHLHSDLVGEAEANADERYLYAFSAIAVFILLLAAVNYMNLATARSLPRAREVGMRKVLGARRGELVRGFLGESLLLTLLSAALSVVVAEFLLPAFGDVIGRDLGITDLLDIRTLGWGIVTALCIGALAGSYPAVFLSHFRPVSTLTGQEAHGVAGSTLRRGLVAFQFAVSIALMAGTGIVVSQVDFLQSAPLGYDTEQVLSVPVADVLKDQRAAFRDELSRLGGVGHVSLSSGPPLLSGRTFRHEISEGEDMHIRVLSVDDNYLDVLGLQLLAGRNLSAERTTDTSAILVNQTAARLLGIEDQVGQALDGPLVGQGDFLAGVVADFHVASLRESIVPTILAMDPAGYSSLVLRLRPGDTHATLKQIEALWRRFAPDEPFSYAFLDEELREQYVTEMRLGRVFSAFSALAVLVACLGLCGLAAFTAAQRTQEIGIRKALGASVANIVALLSGQFLRPVLLAFVLSAPLAYVVGQQWLQGFAYRVEPTWQMFASVGVLALTVAMVTVSYQSVRAARTDPVRSMRYQ